MSLLLGPHRSRVIRMLFVTVGLAAGLFYLGYAVAIVVRDRDLLRAAGAILQGSGFAFLGWAFARSSAPLGHPGGPQPARPGQPVPSRLRRQMAGRLPRSEADMPDLVRYAEDVLRRDRQALYLAGLTLFLAGIVLAPPDLWPGPLAIRIWAVLFAALLWFGALKARQERHQAATFLTQHRPTR